MRYSNASIAFFAWLVVMAPAYAQQQRIHYSTGTGFFISAFGDIITNAHVVQDCLSGGISTTGAVDGPAKLIATDPRHDLALLRTERGPRSAAQLAVTKSTIDKGDAVMVIGYPMGQNVPLRNYNVAHAEIIDVKGPQNEQEWLQFSDSAQQGNSGGPLLDEAGNVIGVVTGKTELFRIDRRTRERTLLNKSDIAVALPVLKRFLMNHQIRFQQADSRTRRSSGYIETRARDFIAQIRCVTAVEQLP